MKILLAQCSPKVGDLAGNTTMIIEAMMQAHADGCDLIVFPELILTGYPPEDLLLLPSFMVAVRSMLAKIQQASEHIAVLLGFPCADGDELYNSLAVFHRRSCLFQYHKQQLPNYGVFDERRYFSRGSTSQPLTFCLHQQRIGVAICEDLWHPDFVERMKQQTVDLWLSINASPFHIGKAEQREALVQLRAQQMACPVSYVNCVGGQDELVFDGGTQLALPDGQVFRTTHFSTSYWPIELQDSHIVASSEAMMEPLAQLHQALVCGIRDYVRNNHGARVVLGLSGGIDSALTAVLAVDALGADAVLGVLLPSLFSSDHSVHDAEVLARNLGIECCTLPVASLVESAEQSLQPLFDAWGYVGRDVCEENIQARSRGLLLMAIANKTGRMLLTTGNKSELAVGYATLYGDMCGAFSALKDVYKTQVFALSQWLNEQAVADGKSIRIPQNTIDKPPSAELSPNQVDADSLPDYDVLDAMLYGMIEQHQSVADLIEQGFDRAELSRIERLLHQVEFKRRQSPPGVKVTTCAFGRDRRFPMTHQFRSGQWVDD